MAIDYEAIFGSDEYDPCAALRALRPAYMKMLSGASVETIKFRDREMTFHAASLKEFGVLIEKLEADCRAKRGPDLVNGPRRFAITVGARRGC